MSGVPPSLRLVRVIVAPLPVLKLFRVNVASGVPPSLRLVRVSVAPSPVLRLFRVNVASGGPPPFFFRLVRISVTLFPALRLFRVNAVIGVPLPFSQTGQGGCCKTVNKYCFWCYFETKNNCVIFRVFVFGHFTMVRVSIAPLPNININRPAAIVFGISFTNNSFVDCDVATCLVFVTLRNCFLSG